MNTLESKIKNVQNKIKKDIQKDIQQPKNTSFTRKLQPYTEGLYDFFLNPTTALQSNNNNRKNTKGKNNKGKNNKGKNNKGKNNKGKNINGKNNNVKEKDIFDSPYLLGFILIIALLFIIYGIYRYNQYSKSVQTGKTFYGENLAKYDPIFELNTDNIKTCIDRCKKDSLCHGITYNKDSYVCYGTDKNGRIRDDTGQFQAWVKPKIQQEKIKPTFLFGYTHRPLIFQSVDLPYPYNPSEYNFSFYLYIQDFYEHHGFWKHIFHKGTTLESNDLINTPYWENISKTVPNQTIGCWMAPYNNNLRIAVTTFNAPHEGSGDTLEFVDIYKIPIKKLLHLSINIHQKTLEIYLDSKLYKIVQLNGYPYLDKNGPLMLLHPKALNTDIYDFNFSPKFLSLDTIRKFYAKHKQHLKNIQETSSSNE